MKKDIKFYWTLFYSTFSLSAFTIGGGYVIVPLMRKKFVEELDWIDEEEMLNLVAISQSAPGPIAVNTSIMVGYRLAGVRGLEGLRRRGRHLVAHRFRLILSVRCSLSN